SMAESKAKICVVCTAFLLLVFIFFIVIIEVAKRPNTSPTEATFTKGAVAADNANCSEIGLNILKKGGTAVEAAIAALLCTGIMNPQSAGIGGGSIFTIMNSSGHVKIINSRETAPSNVDPDLLKSCPKDSSKAAGIKWIGVPGEIRGYELAHNLYKNLNWTDLFNETIELARNGFPIPPALGSYLPEIKETESLSAAVWTHDAIRPQHNNKVVFLNTKNVHLINVQIM
uniref:Gamma-glutamyltransferase 5a n=1 Tax=Xiphophorus maculatus TaxID=8083 RepID=A0A3B5QFW0_XIPMA